MNNPSQPAHHHIYFDNTLFHYHIYYNFSCLLKILSLKLPVYILIVETPFSVSKVCLITCLLLLMYCLECTWRARGEARRTKEDFVRAITRTKQGFSTTESKEAWANRRAAREASACATASTRIRRSNTRSTSREVCGTRRRSSTHK